MKDLNEPSDFEPFLSIDKNALDEELIRTPALTYRAGIKYSYALAKRDRYKDQLKMVKASVNARIIEESEEKLTLKALELLVDADDEVISMHKRIILATRRMNAWDALRDALRQRSYALREICQLYGADYFAPSSSYRRDERPGRPRRKRETL